MKKGPLVKVALGAGKFRGRVTFSTDPEEPGSTEERLRKLTLLKSVADDPALQVVGDRDFETLKMTNAGGKWYLELEADLQ